MFGHVQTVSDDDTDQTDRKSDRRSDRRSGRRSRTRIALAVLVIAALAIGAGAIVTLANDRADLRDRVDELEESLRIAQGDAGARVELLESEIDFLLARIDELETVLTSARDDLETSRDEASDLADRLAERDAERAELQEQLAELQEITEIVGTEIELMPDLFGAPIEEVTELAEELQVELIVVEVDPNNVIARPGDVIDQLPVEETPLLPGSVVWVEVYTPDDGDDG